jgi:cytochrome oxidase Cu insertion factor (SCO1/SenC/PrrC family)
LRRSKIAALVFAVTLLARTAAAQVVDDETRRLMELLAIPYATRPATVPTFSLHDLKGNLVHLDDFRDRVVMLYFWTTW